MAGHGQATSFAALAGPPALVPVANKPMVTYALDALSEAGIREAAVVVDPRRQQQFRSVLGDGSSWGLSLTVVPGFDACGLDLADLLRRAGLDTAGTVAAVDALAVVRDGLVAHLDTFARERLEGLFLSADTDKDEALPPAEEHRTVTSLHGRPRPAPARHRDVVVGILASRTLARMRTSLGDSGLGGVADDLLEAALPVRHEHGVRAWRWSGSTDGLLAMNRLVLDDLCGRDLPPGSLEDSKVQGRVQIDPTAHIRASVIRGPAVIGPGARIFDAYIGPYTAIGDDVVVDAAEIEHCIILGGSSVRHLGRRLEASVVGARSRIFRSFALPEALRLHVGAGAEICLA